MSKFTSSNSHTVGINFLLFDGHGQRAALSDKIQVFHISDNTDLKSLIYRAELGEHGRTHLENRIILLEILSHLTTKERANESSIISESIRYLSEHIDEAPSVSSLATHCGVSEVYLRKKFKEYMGTSPAKYRNELRLSKSIGYLKFGDISIQEISDTLGYATVSHFIKEFKCRYGISPLQYRKNTKG